MKTILLSVAYFAPIRYYSELLSADSEIIVEKHENYNKQSYRNRCTIYSANGMLDLVIPVAKTGKPKIPIAEVEIGYGTPWQKLHFKAIESAYRQSPFYEYYIDDLKIFFEERHRFLYDLDMKILQTLCGLMKIPFRVRESDEYMKTVPGTVDLRNGIHPKSNRRTPPDTCFVTPRYTQVFSDKSGFIPDLSILDLLFHTGPGAKDILQSAKTA